MQSVTSHITHTVLACDYWRVLPKLQIKSAILTRESLACLQFNATPGCRVYASTLTSAADRSVRMPPPPSGEVRVPLYGRHRLFSELARDTHTHCTAHLLPHMRLLLYIEHTRYSTLLAAHAAAMHLPRETLIPTPLPFTTSYILHLHYPGRLSTGAGAR